MILSLKLLTSFKAASGVKSIFEGAEEVAVIVDSGDLFDPTIAINQRTGQMVRTKTGELPVASSLRKKFPALEKELNENAEIITMVSLPQPINGNANAFCRFKPPYRV